MTRFVIDGAVLLDVVTGELVGGSSVRVEGDRVVEVGVDGQHVTSGDVRRIDAAGRTLMPGLIDAHVHAAITRMDIGSMAHRPLDSHRHRGQGDPRRDAAAWLHDDPRRRWAGSRAEGCRRGRAHPRPAHLPLRASAVADRWPWRHDRTEQPTPPVRVRHQHHRVRARRRRTGRRAPRRTRGAEGWRRSDQGDGWRWRGDAERPDRHDAVHRRASCGPPSRRLPPGGRT